MSSTNLAPLPDGHKYWVAGSGPLRVVHDWRVWIAANDPGATIVASAWTTPDPEITLDPSGDVDEPDVGFTTTTVSGGTAGNRAKLVEVMTTSTGNHPKRTIHLHCVADIPL